MRFLALFFLAAAFRPNEAAAQLLSHKAIIEAIEGRWAISYDDNPDPELLFRCEGKALNIWLEEDGERLIYRSQREGEELVESSLVQITPGRDGEYLPWIELQYEGDTRLTDDGVPVRWRLVMTDKDTFYWARADWEWGNFTTARRRCVESEPGV